MGPPGERVEIAILTEKHKAFRGSAKIRISELSPEVILTNPPRQLDLKNVARLRRIYEIEGCQRLEPEHHVPVLVDEEALGKALKKDGVPGASLKGLREPPLLEFGTKITYLHGRHRLEAGVGFLGVDDRWWVADIYLEGELLACMQWTRSDVLRLERAREGSHP